MNLKNKVQGKQKKYKKVSVLLCPFVRIHKEENIETLSLDVNTMTNSD